MNNITLLNSLNEVDQNSIWTPRLAFVNALGPYQTVVDEQTAGVLVREDDPLDEDVTLPIEGEMDQEIRFSVKVLRVRKKLEYAKITVKKKKAAYQVVLMLIPLII